MIDWQRRHRRKLAIIDKPLKKLNMTSRNINKRKPHRHGKLYSSKEWKALRNLILYENPLCVECGVEIATDVDHIIKHNGDREMFYDKTNLQALCKECHKAKTKFEKQKHL